MISIDTNVFAYAAGLRRNDADEVKIVHANRLLEEWGQTSQLVIAVQVFAELHSVLVRRLRLPREKAEVVVREYMDLCESISTTEAILTQAFTLAARHNLQTYDAIILAAAADAGCDTLYSEDMKHGFVWRSVEVVNPFLEG